MHAQLDRPVRVADLAREAGVHRVHLGRAFRDEFGETVGDYHRRIRIEWASRELALGAPGVTAVAQRAGFADQSHFTRFFKRIMGMTPVAWTRKHARIVIVGAALVGAGLVPAPSALAAQDPRLVMRLERLTDSVALISGFANGNILVVAGGGELLLVDGQSTRRVGLADSALRTFSALPVRTVVNTHYHGDHTEGNAHWRERGARIIAHANVVVQGARDTVIPEMEWTRTALPAAARPSSTFDDSLVLRVGSHEVGVIHLPPSHTDGDAIIWLPDDDILHVGDVVETEAFPFIDWWAGGSLEGTAAVVDLLLERIGPRTRIVPGHGPVVGREFLLAYRTMLETVGGRISRAIATGQTLEQVQAARPTAEFEPRFGSERSGRNFVRVVYLGLSRR